MYKHTKKFLDFFISLCLIILLFPLYIMIILLIFFFDGKPIFFIQKRVGKRNKYFYIYKFRTLIKSAPRDLPTNDFKNIIKHLTNTGFLLRKTSLDELPQLLNILLGNMSFIGPRPLLWNQSLLIREREINKSNLVKPGITGLAQITKSAWDNDNEKVRLDKVYVDNLSFKQDFTIFLKTIVFIINRLIH